MKNMKKLLGLLLSVVMVLAMALPTMAATTTTTISAPDGSTRTYNVYQIFKGDLTTIDGKEVLSNVVWGQNGTGTTDTAVDDNTLTALKSLASSTDNQTKLAEITKYVTINADQKVGTVSDGKSLDVPTGYYLIEDAGPVDEGEAYSLYVVQIVGPTKIQPKVSTTTSEKKVDDKNDSDATEDETNWKDTADYDINDDVPFQLKATIGDNYANYKTYQLTFHDEQSAGLSFNKDSVVVKIDDKEIDSSLYSVKVKGTDTLSDSDCTFEVSFAELKNTAAHSGSVITVNYTSKLNENANLGTTGNPNTSHVTYSNNPNSEQGGEEGTTPDDTVIVFSYKTVVNKVDESGKALTGAAFTLEKYDVATQKWIAKTTIKNDEGTVFTFSGLDDGKYRLTETDTPEGYNSIDPIYFTVTASHKDGDSPYLESLSATQTDENGTKLTEGVVATFTASLTANDASLSTNVVNKMGSTLPETGGIGTTIFYIVGGVLVLGAVVLLVTRKRVDGAR